MSKPLEVPHQSYDRIFKELFSEMPGQFVKAILGVELIHPVVLPTEVTVTTEKDYDFLIEDQGRKREIYHFEFQTQPDSKMLARMLAYQSYIFTQKGRLARQIVIYLGNGKPRMRQSIETKRLKYSYEIISLNELDADIFFNSADPSVVILSILAKSESGENTLHQMIERLRTLNISELTLSKYVNQLLICANLRKLDLEFKETIAAMPIILKNLGKSPLFDEERKIVREEGRVEGREEGREEMREEMRVQSIINARVKLGLNTEQIAAFVEQPVEYVEQVLKKQNL